MRRNDKEITDNQLIEKIIKESYLCHLAFNDELFPYILPFNYGYDGKHIFIHSATEGKKLDLIKKSNKIGFSIVGNAEILKFDKACKWTTKYQSLVGNGTAEILDSYEDKIYGLEIIMKQHGRIEENIFDENSLKKMIIIRISIDYISGKQSGKYD